MGSGYKRTYGNRKNYKRDRTTLNQLQWPCEKDDSWGFIMASAISQYLGDI
jgi:hypothetical protein